LQINKKTRHTIDFIQQSYVKNGFKEVGSTNENIIMKFFPSENKIIQDSNRKNNNNI